MGGVDNLDRIDRVVVSEHVRDGRLAVGLPMGSSSDIEERAA